MQWYLNEKKNITSKSNPYNANILIILDITIILLYQLLCKYILRMS